MSGRPTSCSTRSLVTEHGMAYSPRGPGSRSRGSSRGSHAPPGRTGEPCTGRSCDPFPRNDATRQGWGAEVEEIFDNLGVVEVQFLSP